MLNTILSSLKVVSYNSRGFNSSKQCYVQQLLSSCDILFLQEHWQSEAQVVDLCTISDDHLACGVSGFGNDEVLSGRPYGGCAVFWRNSLCFTPEYITTHSRRVFAVMLKSTGFKLLCVCVYMPYEKDTNELDEFSFQLSVVDSIISQHSDCHVVVGGDFNVDFCRDRLHTVMLNDFCSQASLHPDSSHSNYHVDFTYNNNMECYSTIDHFLLSAELYRSSINEVYVLHNVDNFSDHDPVCIVLNCSVACLDVEMRIYRARTAWCKASDGHVAAYRNCLRVELQNVVLPHEALLCDDVFCCNAEHIAGLSQFADHITAACLKSAAECIPSTKPCGASGRIPGWTEHVAPLRSQSLFWHRLWQDCGKPHSGIVADIMRRSRARYHAAVRQIRRQQADIVNDRIAAALAENSNRNFWDEIKRIRQNKRNTVGVVDGLCASSDIANLFAGKYRNCILVCSTIRLICKVSVMI